MAKTKAAALRKNWASYTDYLKSKEWQAIRKEVIKRDGGDCRFCGSPVENDKKECHHWQYPKDWNDDSVDNVILSCHGCHDLFHKNFDMNSASFDSSDDCVISFLRIRCFQDFCDGMESQVKSANVHLCELICKFVKAYKLTLHIETYPKEKFYIGKLTFGRELYTDVLEKLLEEDSNA